MLSSLNGSGGAEPTRVVVPLDLMPFEMRAEHQALMEIGLDLRYPLQLHLHAATAGGTPFKEIVDYEILEWVDDRKIHSERDLLELVTDVNTEVMLRHSQQLAHWTLDHLYQLWRLEHKSYRVVAVTENFLVIDMITDRQRTRHVYSLPSRHPYGAVVSRRAKAEGPPVRRYRS